MKNIENNNLFPISLLIDRIISKFNPTNCNNLHIVYSLVFDNQDPIYLEVKDGFCKLFRSYPFTHKYDNQNNSRNLAKNLLK